MKFEKWYEENFGAVEPGVPFHLPVLKFAYESGAEIEREACAKVCEDLIGTRAMARHCADAIRSRGGEK
jgi:hypothetical protein